MPADAASDVPAVPDSDATGPAPHPHESTLRWRVALIAIGAAGITALATLGGQLWAAKINTDAQRDVAIINFTLNQQVEAYAKHISDQSVFRVKAGALIDKISVPFSVTLAQTDLRDLRELLTLMEQDDSVVAIVARPRWWITQEQ